MKGVINMNIRIESIPILADKRSKDWKKNEESIKNILTDKNDKNKR